MERKRFAEEQIAFAPRQAESGTRVEEICRKMGVCDCSESELPGLPGGRDVLDQLIRSRGKPQSLRVDNGPEFAGRMLDQWAYLNGVEIDFSRPAKTTDIAFIEALNAHVRAECLNASWFLSMADTHDRIEEWTCQYNEDRPHSALGDLTPNAFADQASKA